MSISEQDRLDYEEGKRDSQRSVVDQAIIDNSRACPDTAAYRKGRIGEALDASKEN